MSPRHAIVLPGGQYGPHSPLLMYAADAAERRGARIQPVWWDDYSSPITLTESERGPWVKPQVERAVADAPDGALVIGKSLGTYGSAVTSDRNLPAVWLTPPLTNEWVVPALSRATAPFLLVGGTADPVWDSALAHKLTPYVLEVKGADHGMFVPGRLAASAEVLGLVATAVEDFLDEVVWPG